MTEKIDLRGCNFRKDDGSVPLSLLGGIIGESFQYWRDSGRLKMNDTLSFGVVAMIVSEAELETLDLGDPNSLFDFGYIYGSHGPRYAANAVRKQRATARTGQSTLAMQAWPALFQDVVGESDLDAERHDGPIWFGDFPYAGAVVVRRNGKFYFVAVSGFEQHEDHWLAEMLAQYLALKDVLAE